MSTMYGSAARGVQIRSLVPSDYAWVRAMEMDPTISGSWRHGGLVPSFNDYVRSLWQRALLQCVVIDDGDGDGDRAFTGLVTCYDANLRSGTAWLAALATPEQRRAGDTIVGLGLLIDALFANWPLRKLYLEVTDSTRAQFSGHEAVGFRREVRFAEDIDRGDRYESRELLAVDRERWAATGGRLLGDARRRKDQGPVERPPLVFDDLIGAIRVHVDLPDDIEPTDYLVRDLELDSLDVLLALTAVEDLVPGFELPEQLDLEDVTLLEILERSNAWAARRREDCDNGITPDS